MAETDPGEKVMVTNHPVREKAVLDYLSQTGKGG